MLKLKILSRLMTVLLSLFFLAGCRGDGATGKWTGKSDIKDESLSSFANALSGGPLTGPSYLTLNSDGTGFLKIADKAETPIVWKQEGEKVILEGRRILNSRDAANDKGEDPAVATLSSDHKTMIIDMGRLKITLNKQT